MDYIGPITPSSGGYQYILVLIGKFPKWVKAFPTRNYSTVTTAKILVREVLEKAIVGSRITLATFLDYHSGLRALDPRPPQPRQCFPRLPVLAVLVRSSLSQFTAI